MAFMADGSSVDATGSARFSSKQPKIVSVSREGICQPVSDGQAEILVEFGGKSAKAIVTAREAKKSRVPSFRQEVLPILTKAGCNAGACHGKLSGQNGFKLSLLGFEPAEDYEHLVKEARGRRLTPAPPERSLVLQKASGRLPHGGGKRLEPDSDDYRTLARWIGQGMPYGRP